jgi:antirestriction protein ArdC
MATKQKRNIYEEITTTIITKLEQGLIPWNKPWSSGGPAKNLSSKKEYRGINQMLLGMSDYKSPYWVTFKQAKALKGQVRKGEKSTMVVFWKMVRVKDEDDEAKIVPFLRHYCVFNVEQCDGLESVVPGTESVPEPLDFEPLAAAEAIVQGMPNAPSIEHKGTRACYAPAKDAIRMPEQKDFDSVESYYATLFHELGHSTGHRSRLNRDTMSDVAAFGSQTYSKEELVAEFTSAFLCGRCDIAPAIIENAAAYIQGWLKKLRNDNRLLVNAGAQAQKAADYILNVQHT